MMHYIANNNNEKQISKCPVLMGDVKVFATGDVAPPASDSSDLCPNNYITELFCTSALSIYAHVHPQSVLRATV